LAFEHDAIVVVCSSPRLDKPMRFAMATNAIIDPRDAGKDVGGVRELTQWYTSQLESAIRRQPDQYWWLHRRWKDTRKKRQPQQKAA
jgi:KDO2-lipid IV(A) lauroyltransferase